MKNFYSYMQVSLLLICLFFSNYRAYSASAVPDNSISVSADKTNICQGENITIYLSTSETGVAYQLKADGVDSGSPINGTGSQISFLRTPSNSAVYSITASNTTTFESADLTQTISITVNTGPDLNLPVTASDAMLCKGEGVIVSVNNTENTYEYLLNNGPDDFPPSIAGNGGIINFPQVFPSNNTTYQVYVSGGACYDKILLNNTVNVDVAAAPKTDLVVSADHASICPGETVNITVENSQSGIDYKVFDGSSYVAGPISGTGSNISFALSPTSTELYTVRAFGPSCLSYYNLDTKVMVTVGATPKTALALTADKTELCVGEPVIIGLSETESGVEYQLTDGSNSIGSSVIGDGNALSFAATYPAANTNYTVEVNANQCSQVKALDSSIGITVNSQPLSSLNVSPANASICTGESISIIVEASENNVSYQLSDGSNAIGTPINGTGSSIEFTVQPDASTLYEIQATRNSCTTIIQLDSKSDVSLNSLPNLDLTVSATPTEICEGEATVIGIENSEAGVNYQLKDASGNIGAVIPGNGGQINFPAQYPTSSNTYLIDAIKPECSQSYQINNQADVVVNPQPASSITFAMNPGTICQGETSLITINSSEKDIQYDVIGSVEGVLGSDVGTGNDLGIIIKPNQSQTLQIQAQNLTCSAPITYPNSLNITVNPGPQLDLNVVASETQICESKNVPVTISVENSQNGLSYWLKDQTGTVLESSTGNGGNLNFSQVSPTSSTTYIVETTMAGCNDRLDLQNRVDVKVIPLPISDINLSISEPKICIGEKTIISMDTSELGVSYQLYDGTYNEGNPIAGTGTVLAFPEFSPFRSVYYQVIATNDICGISVSQTNQIRVDVGLQPEDHLHPTIDKHTICEGEEVVISLTPTDTKVSYQLWDDTTAIGSPVTGNNEVIHFTPTIPDSSTTYRIEAMGEKCLQPIDIRYTVDVNVHHHPQTNLALNSDRDTLCPGEEVKLSIENSEMDMIYQLYDGSNYIEPNVVGNGGSIKLPVQNPNTSTTYSVYAHETVCNSPLLMDNTKLIFVPDITPNSVESFATPDEFCEGEAIDIELPNSINGIQYILQDGDAILSELKGTGQALVFENITPTPSSQLKITIGNCLDEMIAALPDYTLQTNPKLQILTTEVQSGYDGNLVVSVSEGVAPYTYIINPGETVTIDNSVLELSGLEAGTYQVLVVDGNACRSSDAGQLAEIKIDEDRQVIVNNALTPNGDGINDEWIIHSDLSLGNPEVYVFNIYGQQVYHAKAYQNNWKGTYNGSKLANGAYYYLIEFDDESIKPIKGSLSILGN